MQKLVWRSFGGFLMTVLLSAPAWAADSRPAARPGTLNYVEGQASVDNQTLDAKSIGSVELQPGQSLETQAGKAEILLTPGVFVRLGDESALRMISPGLTQTQVELLRGSATVEVADLHRENNVAIVEDGATTELLKNGLYEFDANQHQVLVFDGEAMVREGTSQTKVKGGHEVTLNPDATLKSVGFDKKALEQADLYRWTSLRSSYLAEANTDAARTYVVGGYGWVGDGWYWDPWYGAYTFLPGDGIFYSPFGWGFYSPGFVFGAPVFYGGRFYHHFGYDYHAWGPGWHYGSPYNYGHGVHYGPQAAFGYHGGAYGGYHGGAYQGHVGGGSMGGGFHGGGGGGFHGGGGGGHGR